MWSTATCRNGRRGASAKAAEGVVRSPTEVPRSSTRLPSYTHLPTLDALRLERGVPPHACIIPSILSEGSLGMDETELAFATQISCFDASGSGTKPRDRPVVSKLKHFVAQRLLSVHRSFVQPGCKVQRRTGVSVVRMVAVGVVEEPGLAPGSEPNAALGFDVATFREYLLLLLPVGGSGSVALARHAIEARDTC